jgi:hypothetical protein
MRIWCVPVCELDDHRLLGEHTELHAMFTILTQNRRGYRNHPQTKRFEDRVEQLVGRHEEQVAEMTARGFTHRSPLAGGVRAETYRYDDTEYRADQALLWEKWGGQFRGRQQVGDWSRFAAS